MIRKIILAFLFLALIIFAVSPVNSVVADDAQEVVIRVGAYENAPKIFTDDEGNVTGLFPVILEYIASEEGWKLEWAHGTWEQCLERLDKNELDIMVDVAFSEERSKQYDFNNETVFVNWGVIYTNRNVDVQSFRDLQGKKVATMRDSIHTTDERGIKKLVDEFDINCTIIEVDDYQDVFELLNLGEADAGVVNRTFGELFARDYGVKETGIIFNPSELRFALTKGANLNLYLIERIDYHLKELKNNPNSIYYGAIHEFIERRTLIDFLPGWVLPVLAGVVGFMLFLFFTSLILRRQVKARTAELQIANEQLRQKEMNLQKAMEDIRLAIGMTTEVRDPYTAGHQKRVSELACAIAIEMNMTEEQIDGIRISADLHDIGKIQVPSEFLCKPGRLTQIEFDIIKGHSRAGYEILKPVSFSYPIAQIVLQHHERVNGSGYPSGLSGESILIEAKILGVADVVEAMSSHRPYRRAFDIEEALDELVKNKGILYDPVVVDACLKVFKEKGFKFKTNN